MVRRYARAPKGERVYGGVPRNRGKNTTLVASLSLEGIGEAMAFEGTATKAVFESYVERVLAPVLEPGQIVVMDNLGAHKGERVKELIEARGATLLFLPAYSPDFSPIEEAFSKIKALSRKRRLARTSRSSKRLGRRSRRSRLETPWAGSSTAATRSDLNGYEYR